MEAIKEATIYDDVVSITYRYLGPAAERFVTRQIQNHLSKNPHQLKKNELTGLIDWFKIAMALLSDDEKLVHQYAVDLKTLAGGKTS